MNVKKIVGDVANLAYIVWLLIYILISSIIIKYDLYTVLDFSTILIYFAGGGLLIYIINKIINKNKPDIYDALIIILILCGIISTVYAYDVQSSLFGFNGRCEGLFQLCLYYILFLNCKDIKNKVFKIIIVSVVICFCIVHTLYGILQYFDIKDFLGLEILKYRAYSTGFEINPNFFGTVTIIGLSLSLLIYLIKENIFVSIIALISSVILFLGLLCSGAMSCAVALIVLLFLTLVLLFIIKGQFVIKIIKCFVILLCFFAVYKLYDTKNGGYYIYQLGQSAYEMGELLQGDAQPIHGSGRIYIWQTTLKEVPKNIWNGVGIDNFYYMLGNDGPLWDVNSGLVVDKAHNEYLQKLITEGIFSFLTYLALLLILVIKSIKKIFKSRKKCDYLFFALFMCFCSYSVQAFFNISVISVAPIFYIVMGLLCSLIGDDKDGEVKC